MQCLPVIGRGIIVAVGLGAAGFIIYDAGVQIQRTRRLMRLLAAEARPLSARLRQMAGPLGIAERILYIADPRPVAFCCGFFRPRIVVSTGLVRALGRAELRAVLRHEAHHLRQRDPLRLSVVRTLARAACYLPIVFDLRRRCEVGMELAADDVVLAAEPVPALAGALYKSLGSARLAPALVATGAFDATGARIARLAGEPPRLPGISYRRLAVSLLVAGGLLIGAATAAYAAGPGAAAGCCTQGAVCPTHN
jgi:Zn-dependent protease with chaperone function